MYYQDKKNILGDIFAAKAEDIKLSKNSLQVNQQIYPIIDDVIILAEPSQYTEYVKKKLKTITKSAPADSSIFRADIQQSFGNEWTIYDQILGEHKKEFSLYFDIIQFKRLTGRRICDLGCGNGRWSYFMADKCRELILIDFSDAVFVARKNLADHSNCLFFMLNLKQIPFKENFCDFLFCLGVLHHLPTPCLEEVVRLKKYAQELLIFLYYSLDNRPAYYRFFLKSITIIRKILAKIKNPFFRKSFSWFGTIFIYLPLVYLGHFFQLFNMGKYIPLYDFYKNKSIKRIRQDVYDRFFTTIEQRVSRAEILKLKQHFSKITVSENLPYWHFLCRK